MGQTVRFQETLRSLTMIDEGFIEDQAGLGLARTSGLDPRTAALLRLGAAVAIGSPAVCLEWCAGRALAAGAVRTRSLTCCRRSPPWPGSPGSSPPRPMWQPRSGMTSRPRWRNWMIADGSSAGHVDLSADRRRRTPELRMNSPGGRSAWRAGEVSGGAGKEADIAARDQPGGRLDGDSAALPGPHRRGPAGRRLHRHVRDHLLRPSQPGLLRGLTRSSADPRAISDRSRHRDIPKVLKAAQETETAYSRGTMTDAG
jgi:hypothetical protein